MCEIIRREVDENWADAAIVEAGDFIFIGYCMKNEGEAITAQISGAFDVLEERLEKAGLTLESVVKMDCLFRNIKDLDFLPEIIRKRFSENYPARKAFETKFIRDGIDFQIDAVAFRKR